MRRLPIPRALFGRRRGRMLRGVAQCSNEGMAQIKQPQAKSGAMENSAVLKESNLISSCKRRACLGCLRPEARRKRACILEWHRRGALTKAFSRE